MSKKRKELIDGFLCSFDVKVCIVDNDDVVDDDDDDDVDDDVDDDDDNNLNII